MMRVIITGGTGSIGVPLSNQLQSVGHEVIILSRNPDNVPEKLHDAIQLHRWDAKTGAGWSHLIDDNTAIVNLAGKNPANWRWTDTHKQQVLDSRINAAQAVIAACTSSPQKPQALIQASAVGYYGDTGQDEIREDAPAGTTWRAKVCQQWESAAQPIETMGIRVAYIRVGIVLDPAGGALPPFILAGKLMGKRLGDGQQWIPWIHNDDVSRAIQYLLENNKLNGIFNVCAPHPVQNYQLMQRITQALLRPEIFPVPAFALKLALGEMSKTILDSQRIIPQALLEAGYTFKYPNLEPALSDLL